MPQLTRRAGTAAALAAGLSGCVTPHQASTGPDSATLILSTGTEPASVQAFANRQCGVHPQGTRLAYFFRDRFDPPTGVTRTVQAGRELVFTFRLNRHTGTTLQICEATRAFVPQAGRRYRAHFEEAPGGCLLMLSELESPAGEAPRERPIDADVVVPACFDGVRG